MSETRRCGSPGAPDNGHTPRFFRAHPVPGRLLNSCKDLQSARAAVLESTAPRHITDLGLEYTAAELPLLGRRMKLPSPFLAKKATTKTIHHVHSRRPQNNVGDQWRMLHWDSTALSLGRVETPSFRHRPKTGNQAAPEEVTRPMSSRSTAHNAKKRALDRDTIMSVLEASVNRRDAKGYLQKYTPPNPLSMTDSPRFVQGKHHDKPEEPLAESPANVAIVKLREPQSVDDETLLGIGRTLAQLRVLGLVSVVVVDCGLDEDRSTVNDQALRLCEAIDTFQKPGAKIVDNVFVDTGETAAEVPSFLSHAIRVEDQGHVRTALQHGIIPVIPALARKDNLSASLPAEAGGLVLALTKHLTGPKPAAAGHDNHASPNGPEKIASVERIILLDLLGGTPFSGQPGNCHRFVNLEQEYDTLIKQLKGPEGSPSASADNASIAPKTHAANLSLVREALYLLPASSSALITTPYAAATPSISAGAFGLNDFVTTRKKQNPVLHNLLTDKPVYSSSLPVKRVHSPFNHRTPTPPSSQSATLVKYGMPLTIYPDPYVSPWTPPKPGEPQPRLTDNGIDLSRLVHLIEDSFGRKLDVEDYLNRVQDNLAGIIIAGEYEGGAILTWEHPQGQSNSEAYAEGSFVPYLDKFAVLKRCQGSGGVADIVFNAMVRDCFPKGVCWRSRKDNPVNKWYFERSMGTAKLSGCNWTMFWTTPELDGRGKRLADYESVCRGVQPSWADNKHVLD